MHLGEPLEEEPVARHREKEPWKREHHAIRGAEDRNENDDAEESSRPWPQHRARGIRGYAIARRDTGDTQRAEITDVRQDVDPDEEQRSDDDAAAERALRIDGFSRGEAHILPPLVSPEH